MYMIRYNELREFEWDEGNIHKSYKKHGISIKEAEEIFIDEFVVDYKDDKHSELEDRYVIIGQTSKLKILFIVYTIRKNKIRIISVRLADKKERRLYEKVKENSTF